MFHIRPQSSLSYLSDRTRSHLTPRTPNACPHYSALMTSQTKSPRQRPEERRRSPQNPQLPRKPEQARDYRRQMYLSKVREASDNKRWQTRSDQILRQDFLTRQREWELEQATSAPVGHPSPEEEPEELEVDMVDRILSQEDEEFQALISSMNETNEKVDHRQAEAHEQTSLDYGSDEEEYDRLFMDVMSHPQQASGSLTVLEDSKSTQTQDMDISMG